MPNESPLRILIIGRESNLSQRLAAALPGSQVASGRAVARRGLRHFLPEGSFQ